MYGLLFTDSYPVADGIEFKVHTLGEILDFGEEKYYKIISMFIATPWDYMWPLHENGIDYEKITEFELFVGLKGSLTEEEIEFLFGDTFPLHRMSPAENIETHEVVLMDPEDTERQFNATGLKALAGVIRRIHHIKYEPQTAGNPEAKQYFLEKARKQALRARRRKYTSTLEPLIVSLVNAPEFPYNYNTCKEVTIYQFMCSLELIPKRLSWNFAMHGIHVGMIDPKNLNWSKLNWLS